MVLLTPPRAVVHVDLDGARHIFRVHGWDYPGPDDPLFETGVRAALEFLAERRIVATFFAIAEDLDDPVKRGLLDEIVRSGHELGSHSITHRRLTALSREEQRREIRESRLRLEDAFGVPVHGFRAPAFDFDRVTLEEVGAAGYRYDSSVLGESRSAARRLRRPIGAVPFAWDIGGQPVELPLPVLRGLPFPFHPSYSLILGTWYFRLGLARARGIVPAFVLLFHLTDFAAPLGPDRLARAGSRLFTLSHLSQRTKLARSAAMVDALREAYEIVPTARLLESATAAATPAAR